MVTVSALATTLFLGGWRAPWPLSTVGDDYFNTGWWPLLWFLLKTLSFLFVFVWLRGTLPRMRYDQFMNLGWKVLVPVSLLWIMAAIVLRGLVTSETVSTAQIMWIGGGAVVLLVFLTALIPDKKPPEPEATAPLSGGGYPVPPLDLEVPQSPPRRTAVATSAGATGAASELPGDDGDTTTQEAPRGDV